MKRMATKNMYWLNWRTLLIISLLQQNSTWLTEHLSTSQVFIIKFREIVSSQSLTRVFLKPGLPLPEGWRSALVAMATVSVDRRVCAPCASVPADIWQNSTRCSNSNGTWLLPHSYSTEIVTKKIILKNCIQNN